MDKIVNSRDSYGQAVIAERYKDLYPQLIENSNLSARAAKILVKEGYYWNLLIDHEAGAVRKLVEKLLNEGNYSSIEEWVKKNRDKVYTGALLNKEEPESGITSYWAVTVSPFSGRSFVYGGSGNDRGDFAIAYGANVKFSDGTKWPTSKKKIGESVGEKYWYEFSVGNSKTFKTIDSLSDYLYSKGHRGVLDKEEVDESGFGEYYFIFRP